MRMKDTPTLAKKFVQRAGAAVNEYKTGVEGAGQEWQTQTEKAGDNYAAGVQEAITDKRFQRGVTAAGATKFATRAASLGAQRYPSGIQASEGEWQRGAGPYLEALKNMELPPRRPKGDQGNQLRAAAVAMKLRAIKTGR